MGEIEIGFLTIIVGLAGVNVTMIRMMWRRNGNGKPHNPVNNPHPYNPDDLRGFHLGDMSAGWYVEKHNELLNGLKAIERAIKVNNGH